MVGKKRNNEHVNVSEDDIDTKLGKIYYDPRSIGSFGGVNRLTKEAKTRGLRGVTRARVERYLADEHAYSLHKPARRTYKRNKTYVSGIDAQWQADLADMQTLAKENNGMRYILTVIDVFSKFAWAIPIKDKGAKTMVTAFEELFRLALHRVPRRLQTDKGSEFLCAPVQRLLRVKGVQHFTSESDKKAAVVERFNRTIKTRLWTYFTAKQTKRYVDVLQQHVDSYNGSVHRMTRMAPKDVRKKHETEIWRRLYDGEGVSAFTKRRSEPKAGELVRLSRWKGHFEKGYLPNWSKETFHVVKVKRHPRTVFEVRDKEGEEIKGNFYAPEVQRVKFGEYVIERVLKRRVNKSTGARECLVKWEGWPDSYNSWVAESSMRDHV
jgi:Integrase core domain/Chromo (CHRromatin Organisation MOdifier) domain